MIHMCWRGKMCCKLRYIILIIGFFSQCVRPENHVGCLFSPSACEDEEVCFDDNAFGRCEFPYSQDMDDYRHLLGSETTKLLERELTRLFAGGYRWRHKYTQCVVQNILYSSRHKISYDPGLCSRMMQFTLPDVPPEILLDLESPEPEELAYIKFKPNRDDASNAMFADEIFNPPIRGETEFEVKQTRKRAPNPNDSEYANSDWIIQNKYENGFDKNEKYPEITDKDTLFRKLLEVADDTGKLFKQFHNKAERYPDDDVPVVRTELSSDMNQKPAFSEGGTVWLPVDDDELYLTENDVIDPYEKKRVRQPDDVIDSNDKNDINLLGRESEEENSSPDKNNMEVVPEESSYEFSPDDDEDSNFRWNYKHINKAVDDDLTRFSRGDKKERTVVFDKNDDKNLKDVIEDDYLEDQLYAILPVNKGMSTFTRYDAKRYDTKKPGPTYMIHEDEDGVDSSDDAMNMAADGTPALISRLSKASRVDQLLAVIKTPVVSQKSSTVVVPSREVIEAAQRLVVRGGNEIPGDIQTDKSGQMPVGKTFERLEADQPELLEGIDDMKNAKEEDRVANVAQTGEGHIGHFDSVDATHAYLIIDEKDQTEKEAKKLVGGLGSLLNLPKGSFSDVRIDGKQITFKVNPNTQNLNASDVAAKAEDQYVQLHKITGLSIVAAGIGDKVKYEVIDPNKDRRLFIIAFALCGGVAGLLLAVAAAYLYRRHSRFSDKLQNVTQTDIEPSQDYQDLCRQRMASKSNDKPEDIRSTVHSPKRIRSLSQEGQASSSSHSSTSSWNEEPVTSNMDITTGHIILAYMEDHLKNKDRLDREWEGLCAYEAELCATTAAALPLNIKKNRYTDVLPYDHSRVLLTEVSNVSGSDYINASSITDHDPRNPAYIATQGPLPQTAADFWQMIWEQGSVVIVMLSRLMENGVAMCHRYWPEEGSEVYHIYEVHLVSEHIWCDDYLVRSFYLKNLRTNETRTVTQFHFMSWPDNGVPNSTKALLEFRRKVNKSYRGRSCPIVVHCSDGIGRTGTYCLIDMVLNRMAKGAKEIDIAATLEHVRDQRAGMVKTKAQFEFVLMAIAEEVHAILKALSQ